jgi:AraC-like DNA-binding protein
MSPALQPYVARCWQLEADVGAVSSPGRWALPDGHSEWWFVFGDPVRRGDEVVGPGAHVFGVARRAALSQATGRLALVGVVFRPGCAAAALAVDACSLDERGQPLSRFWGHDAGRLWQQLARASSFARRRQLLERALWVRLAPLDREVGDAIVALMAEPTSPVRMLAADAAAVRRLERKFRDRVGLRPKQLARVFRLQQALRCWAAGEAAGWADLAAAAGYADQAHFIREFTAFVGMSPGEFLRRNREMSCSFNTAASPPRECDRDVDDQEP